MGTDELKRQHSIDVMGIAGLDTKSMWEGFSAIGPWVMDTLWTETYMRAGFASHICKYVVAPNGSYARLGDKLLTSDQKLFDWPDCNSSDARPDNEGKLYIMETYVLSTNGWKTHSPKRPTRFCSRS